MLWNAASHEVQVNISFEESITGTLPPARGPGHNGETMNNELLSGTQLRFIEQSSQYEASFTEVYCAAPTTRNRGEIRTQEDAKFATTCQ